MSNHDGELDRMMDARRMLAESKRLLDAFESRIPLLLEIGEVTLRCPHCSERVGYLVRQLMNSDPLPMSDAALAAAEYIQEHPGKSHDTVAKRGAGVSAARMRGAIRRELLAHGFTYSRGDGWHPPKA